MEPLLFLYAAGIWLALFVLALTNGALRESLYALKLGEYLWHVISSVIAMLLHVSNNIPVN
jgi:ABC-type microcin C transport system permease subunit YejB